MDRLWYGLDQLILADVFQRVFEGQLAHGHRVEGVVVAGGTGLFGVLQAMLD